MVSGLFEGVRLMHQSGLLYLFVFIGGACIGSFLNVVIFRWPRDMSIIRPGSRCPECNAVIPWYLNLPVLSWLLLRGRCRFCKARISWTYPAVEFFMGVWAVLMLWRFGVSFTALAYFVFGAGLVAGSVIDFYHLVLPDFITMGLIPLGIGMSFLPSRLARAWPVSGWESVGGAALGAGLLGLTLVGYKLITGRDGMGMGDVKLMGGIGAFLGYQAVPAAILLGPPAGIMAWVALRITRNVGRDYPLPFGPFLSLGALLVVVFREWLEKNWVIMPWM